MARLRLAVAFLAISLLPQTVLAQSQKPSRQPSIVAGQPKAIEVKRDKFDAKVFKRGAKAKWIWGANNDTRYFVQRKFTTDSKNARLIATCDNKMQLWLNGKPIASSTSWERPVVKDVSGALKAGENILQAKIENAGGVSGFACKLIVGDQVIISDDSWGVSEKRNGDWSKVRVINTMGAQPWGDVFTNPRQANSLVSSVPREVFQTRPGFEVELLYNVPGAQQGSWVSMTFDHRGRIIASDQGGKGLYRITPAPIGKEGETKVEKLNVPMTSAQGLLYAFDSLYVSVNGGPGSGLYRLIDKNGDDQYDEVRKLKALRGGGEHGPHALRLSPDGKSIYMIAGNHTDPPQYDSKRIAGKWGEDLLLPRQWDARGHARGKLAPGGWIAKTDPNGAKWEIFSIGYRNPYDMDFNADGELFAYDADMEWDMGSPWYRPTRVVHATSGSEFGWRSGTGKWPTYYADSLPPTVDIGPGSPVGATFGYGAKFPKKYQNALYILDWTFGTMYAIHLQPQGASYIGVKEEFLSRTPLPLTDAAVGPDGALYFTVGGRNTESALYRVIYTGDESTAPAVSQDSKFADARALRRQLESAHHPLDTPAAAVRLALEALHHQDRHIRYAARTALEHQDIEQWRDKILALESPTALINGCAAIARMGIAEDLPEVLTALKRVDTTQLDETQMLELLRTYALSFIRLGRPDADTASAIASSLDKQFPAKNANVNRELARILVYLNSPTVVSKTMKLITAKSNAGENKIPELLARNQGYGGAIAKMLANMPDLQKLHYAFVLRNVKYGWTLEERLAYFAWLAEARTKSGGASYQGFIDNIKKDALANASDQEKAAVAKAVVPRPPAESELPKPKGPGREWTLEEVVKLADASLRGRNFEAGKRAFAAAKCVSCHRFAGEGGATGPDLTNAAGRFSIKDLAESVIHPSRTISDQYRASIVVTDSGKQYTGRLLNRSDKEITLLIDPIDVDKVVRIPLDEIDELTPSKTSLMPANGFDPLSRDEVLDLLAYLLSRGDPTAPVFR